MARFQAPKGTFDVLPPQSARYQRLVARFGAHMERAGYGLVVGPMFEDAEVFTRLGGSTDVVRKEMYDFEDKGGRRIALRPEGTAPVVRAYLEHKPTTPWKVWYVTPKFRYDRPMAGRYRQHHEVGAEVVGTDDPDVDVEVIVVAWDFYAALGLTRVTLKVTSLGDDACRPAYRAELQDYLEVRRDQLCDEHRDRIADNPLRILDCKREACTTATAEAPAMIDRLCAECQAHFQRVQDGLAAADVPFIVDRRLVRGLDYYTRTTFEFAGDALEAAQNAVGGGGRYDGLAEALGGPATTGIGFGLGIERILLACDAEGAFPVPEAALDVFVVDTTGGAESRDLTTALRRAGVACDRSFGDRSMKAQFRAADRSGAAYAVVIGPEEQQAGKVKVQALRATGDATSHTGGTPTAGPDDELVDRADVVAHLRQRLGR